MNETEDESPIVSIVFMICVTTIIILTVGEPDLLDVIIKRLGGN